MKRAALYLRVSREDLSLENQRPELHALAAQRGYAVVEVFEEHVSAAKDRPQHKAMMAAAKRGAFETVFVWSLDRFGRSMAGNIRDVLELERLGVRLCSVREEWLDTAGPVRDLLLAIFSWLAEQERRRLVERTLAGMARARAQGTRIGRPHRMDRKTLARALEMRSEGRSTREMAIALKVPQSTLRRVLARAAAVPTPPQEEACSESEKPSTT